MTKLLDSAGKLIDIPAAEVSTAVSSGRFSFPSNRNIPVIQQGEAKWVDPNFAAQYYKRLTFTEDDVVQQQRAEERMRGVGGTVAGLAYGAAKTATLGLAPLAVGAVSDTARDYMRDIELGAPTATGAGELLGLAIDPFAAVSRVSQRGAVKAAEQAARAAAEQRAAVSPALALGEAATGAAAPPAQAAVRAAEQTAVTGGQGAAMAASQTMPTLGGAQALVPTAEEAARLTAEAEARMRSIQQGAIQRGRSIVGDEAAQVVEEQSLRYRPLAGPTSPADPGLRLGTDIYQTPEMLMRARQAEELGRAERGLREYGQMQLGRAEELAKLPPEPVVPPTPPEPVDLSGFRPGEDARVPLVMPEEAAPLPLEGERLAEATENISYGRYQAQETLNALRERAPDEFISYLKGNPLVATPSDYPFVIGTSYADGQRLRTIAEPSSLAKSGDAALIVEGFTASPARSRALRDMTEALSESDVLGRDAAGKLSYRREYVVAWDENAAREAWKKAGGAGNSRNPISVTPNPEQPFWTIFDRGDIVGKKRDLWKGIKTERGRYIRGDKKQMFETAASRIKGEQEALLEDVIKTLSEAENTLATGKAAAREPLATEAGQLSLADITAPPPELPPALRIGPAPAEVAASEAARAERMAEEVRAANTVPGSLRTAETAVPGNVSPAASFAQRIAGITDGLAAKGAGTLETPGLVSAPGALRVGPAGRMAETAVEGGTGLRLGEAPRAAQGALGDLAAGALMPQLPALPKAPYASSTAAQALQGAVYGGAAEAQRQQLGLSKGGAGDVLASAFAGGAIPLGISALAKGAGAAGKLVAGAAGGEGRPFGEKIAGAAGRMEETAMLRMFGMSKANIRELNALFGRSEEDLRGTRKFVDFIKASFADIERLKQEFPENAALQSIRTDSFLKFGNLKPEQRVAFAQALQNSSGRAIENIYSPFYQVQIPSSEIAAAAQRVRQKLVGQGALGEIPLESIRAELGALTSFLSQGGTHTVGSLRNFENNISRIFRENAGVGKPFTDAQRLFRDEMKSLYVNAVNAASPGAREALPLMNEAYTMAERLAKGALDKEAALASQSAVGPDNLNAAVLGAAGLGQFASALRYLIGAVAVRGFYNQRADGFIADMAQRLGAGAVKMQTNPRVAAQVASRSMIDASRPVMLGLSAQNFTSTTPQDYSDLTEAVRQMGRDREAIAQRMKGAVSNLPPEEQAAALQKVDRIFQALGDNLPQNIEEPGKVSEQARRYTVFARALLDRAYATQVLANGNQDSALAAEALRAQGEDGQKYIDALEEDLRTSINRDRKLQEDQQLLAAHRAIKSHSSKAGIRIGGAGRMRATIHGGLKLPKLPGGGTNPLSAAQMGKTVNAFMGTAGLKQ